MTDVLLVEDQDCVREVLADLLMDAGLEVAEAASGEEALDSLAESGPPDVLVTDLDLGEGVSGLALAEDLSRKWPTLGVVFISGRPWLIDQHPLRPRERFLEKPCLAHQLLAAVHELRPH